MPVTRAAAARAASGPDRVFHAPPLRQPTPSVERKASGQTTRSSSLARVLPTSPPSSTRHTSTSTPVPDSITAPVPRLESFQLSSRTMPRSAQDSFAATNYRLFHIDEVPTGPTYVDIRQYLWQNDGIASGVQCYIPQSHEQYQCGVFAAPGVTFPFFEVFDEAHVIMSNFQLLLFPGGRDAEGKEKFGVFPPCAEPKLERLYDYRVREVALRAEVGVAGMCGPHGHLLMRPVVQGLMRGEFSLKRRGIGLEDIAFEFYAAPCAIWPLDGTITGPARIIMDQDHLISVFGML